MAVEDVQVPLSHTSQLTVTDFENVSSKLMGSSGPSRRFLQLAPVIWTESEALRAEWALLANLNLCAGLQVSIKRAVHEMTAWENAVVAYSSHRPARFAEAAKEMASAEDAPMEPGKPEDIHISVLPKSHGNKHKHAPKHPHNIRCENKYFKVIY